MTVKFTTVPSKRLAETINGSAYSFSLQDIKGWNGSNVSSSDFGTDLYASFRNSLGTKMELMKIDPSTIASASITILKRGLGFDGDQTTEVTANIQDVWVKGDTIVEIGSHVSQLLEETVRKSGNQTIAGVKTFTSSPIVPLTPTSNTEAASKGYADSLSFAGAPDSSETQKGILETATLAEVLARSTSGSTTAPLAVTPANLPAVLTRDYAADAGGTDAYAISLSPALTAYAVGQIFYFKANTANTGACTLNVNGVGVKSLKKNGLDPNDGYIAANSYVQCQYDGTNMNIIWCSSEPRALTLNQAEIYGADAGSNDTYVISLSPAPAAYATSQVFRFKANTANTGAATLNVNGLGAISILRTDGSALANGDIAANQNVEVFYNGTNFLMLSPTANTPVYKNGIANKQASDASTVQNIPHGLGRIPRFVDLTFMCPLTAGSLYGFAYAYATYNGTSQSAASIYNTSGAVTYVTDLYLNANATAGSNIQSGVITFDATNIIITWTKTGSPSGDFYIVWKAQA